MKSRVVVSLEADTGDRCVDILHNDEGYSYRECRKGAADIQAWKYLADMPTETYASYGQVIQAVRGKVHWLNT
jgi:hypothetical protein